jgi:hypothetical protein
VVGERLNSGNATGRRRRRGATNVMWSASAVSRSTLTSAGHGYRDRLISEPEIGIRALGSSEFGASVEDFDFRGEYLAPMSVAQLRRQ